MSDSYTVHTHQYGKYITGSVPAGEYIALLNEMAKKGFKFVNAQISQHYGASLCVVKDAEAARLWKAELGIPEDAE